MKKLKYLFIVLFMVSSTILVSFSAALLVHSWDNEEEPKDDESHVHTYQSKSDFEKHWQECACGDKKEIEEHTFGEWTTTTAPMETTMGVKERQCSICHYKETETLPILPHTHSYSEEWTIDQEPTCTEEGSKSYHCLVCNAKKDITSIPTKGHTFGEWTTNTEPTETTTGIKEKECSVCYYKETETLPILPHTHSYSEEWTIDVEPTCRESGSKSHHCQGCYAKKDITSIPATGHTFGEWTTTTAPTETTMGVKERQCSSCHYKETEILPFLSHTHSYSEEWTVDVEPTCRESGSKSHHCSVCNAKKDITSILAKGHTFGEWTTTTESTETTMGVKERQCSSCHYKETETIPVLPHTHNYSTEWTIDQEPTCTEEGSKSHHCLVCNAKKDITGLEALGHTYVNEVCTRCGQNIEPTELIFELESTGNAYNVKGVGNNSIKDIVIPATYNGKPVTGIGDYAFYDCVTLSSITIPESITSIGVSAFENCRSIISITIPESLISIGESAFENCRSLKGIIIPERVTSIGYRAFGECGNLTNIILPFVGASLNETNNTHFGYIFGARSSSYNFDYVPSSLREVIITGGTSIGSSAFLGCGSLTSIVIPDSVTDVGSSAFSNCNSLTSIEIPNGVTSIGDNAFFECGGLTSITMGDRVTSIGTDAFLGCSSLTNIYYQGKIKDWCNITFAAGSNPMEYTEHFYLRNSNNEWEEVTSIEIPNTITKIGAYQFYEFNNVTSIIIPNSVTSIGSFAFYNCSNLTSITIPDSAASIGSSAFYNCNHLTSITIPNSVTSIGTDAFFGCSGLTSITIGDSVKSIGDNAFLECRSLTNVYYQGWIVDWCNITFAVGSNPMKYARHFYLKNSNNEVTSIEIPNSVKKIGDYQFYGFHTVTSITIPESVTSIGKSAFSGCSHLKEVNYEGSSSDWHNISIGSGNSELTSATFLYGSFT